ncbi:SDR family oxidoreductase [Microbulbifer sp. OS29]|uniref:SDR family oxidoreductase n=1 Tax=Microbulbifer okhotskensis TaxID=2926617 RepID=A0A9X2EQ30_9GAMM|nr:SDR family oxidoreductase [Microbulbifer okhotskensis]MCO1336287.1 SDR family oxidoreductase [Microbulbifer okhotskensis]
MSKPLVVITGASSGIGAGIAKRMSAAGHPLLMLARRLEQLKALQLPNTMCRKVDVTDSDALRGAIGEAEAQYGPVDCLINNAGKMLLGNIETQNPAEWRQMFDVNVLALLNGMQAVLEGMKSRRTGTIINVSSIAGVKSFINHAAYCGTKYAVSAIGETVREEVASAGVRVMTICPGAVETELLSHTTSQEIIDAYSQWKASIGGAVNAEDIARTVMFMYSQPQYVNIREIQIAATGQSQ